MPADLEPLTPDWWVARLHKRLRARQPSLRRFDRYDSGNHELPFVPPKYRDSVEGEYRQLLEQSQSNFCGLIVEAPLERLRMDGFRLSASEDDDTDDRAWEIWQANHMDADLSIALHDAIAKGVSYLSVWRQPASRYSTIGIEDPLETIVGYTPGTNFRSRDAALKTWVDDRVGIRRADLYLPGRLHKYVSEHNTWGGSSQWDRYQPDNETWPVTTSVNEVPIVPLRNRPKTKVEGRSELEGRLPVQDRINSQIFYRLMAGYLAAHRQKWATGIDIPEDENGNPVEDLNSALTRLWMSESPETTFGSFEPTDITQYIKAVEEDVVHLAVQSRTPRHYLIQQGQSPSGDAMKSAETGLVAKTKSKMRRFGEGIEETIRIARMFDGAADAPVDSEVVWGDPEYRTEAELTDAVVKQFQAGLISRRTALSRLGYTQTEIAREMDGQTEDAITRLLSGDGREPAEVPAVA